MTAQQFYCFYHTTKRPEIQSTTYEQGIKKYLQACLQAKKRKKTAPGGAAT
jgi:hypothetical protein